MHPKSFILRVHRQVLLKGVNDGIAQIEKTG